MIELIKEALSMGWPALGVLIALMFYFKASIQDPAASKRAVFKTFIGILGAFLLFMAIANYKMNFFGESRLLPVSLVLITSMTFMMAVYFTNISALLRIGGFMFFIAAALSGYGNWLPQVEGGFPPKEEKKISATCRSLNWPTKVRKLFSAVLGKTRFRVQSVRASAHFAMHSIRVCWASVLQISTGFLSVQIRKDLKIPAITGANRRIVTLQ
ncbi:MAG: hypothetical protein U0231_17835 [Nitrospiraceae bacterium]